MNKQKKQNRWMLVLIVGLCALPLGLAWIVHQNPQWLAGRTNHGELIVPPVPLDLPKLAGFDAFSAQNLGELKGRWVLVHVIGAEGCHQVCRDSLHAGKQIQLMLNKDFTRVRRLAVVTAEVGAEEAGGWWQDDPVLLRVKVDEGTKALIDAAGGDRLGEGALLIMDPMGNLMMRYQPGYDPYGVRKDLGRLLNVSQIG